jgi:catechol 2,3-dioxygenase-like lactoylglutathione lyase family enzyme
MRIRLTSVLVGDQARALEFYTRVLGFVKKVDVPVGEYRWLTVVSPEEPEGTELVLEPSANPAARAYQQALHEQGIPLAAFAVDDLDGEYARLRGLGVEFRTPPTRAEGVSIAVLDDSCGNLIQLYEAGAGA